MVSARVEKSGLRRLGLQQLAPEFLGFEEAAAI
jgi:hypothetical protein